MPNNIIPCKKCGFHNCICKIKQNQNIYTGPKVILFKDLSEDKQYQIFDIVNENLQYTQRNDLDVPKLSEKIWNEFQEI